MLNNLLFVTSLILIGVMGVVASRSSREGLVLYICLQAVFANLLVLKQITLFGYNATPADAFAVGGYLSLHYLQERFGETAAKQATVLGFASIIFFCIVSQIQLLYLPSQLDTMSEHYQSLFAPAPRLLAGSIIAYYISMTVNRLLYSFLRRSIFRQSAVLASTTSLIVSQAIDTVIFAVIGLYGVLQALHEIILVSYSIKLLIILGFIPFIEWHSRQQGARSNV